MRDHSGRALCAICRFCTSSGDLQTCIDLNCQTTVHDTCLKWVREDSNTVGGCRFCGINPTRLGDYRRVVRIRGVKSCECVKARARSPFFENRPPGSSVANAIHICDDEPSEPTTGMKASTTEARNTSTEAQAGHSANPHAPPTEGLTARQTGPRRSQRMPNVDRLGSPDIMKLTLEHCAAVRDEDEMDTNDGMDEEDASIIYEEAYFELGDQTKFIDEDGKAINATVVGRTLNPRLESDFTEGMSISATRVLEDGWVYTVKIKDERGEDKHIDKYEWELVFDTGDDRGTVSDEEELTLMVK